MSWSISTNIPSSGHQLTSLGLAGAISGCHNDAFIVAGGTNFPDKEPWMGGKKAYYDDVFVYCLERNKEKLIRLNNKVKLPYQLAYSAVGSCNEGLVVAGGENGNGKTKKVLLLKWQAKDSKIEIEYLPDLPKASSNAALTIIDHIVYLVGGETENEVSNQFLALNLKDPNLGWKNLPKLPQPVSHAVLLSAVAKDKTEMFLIGGRKSNVGDTSTIYKNVYAFDFENQVWSTKESLPYPLAASAGITLGSELFLFSGDKGETFHQTEQLIADIAQEKDYLKKEILNTKKVWVQANHPGFSKEILRYSPSNNSWTILKNILPYGTVTTQAVLFQNEIIIAGGEVKAGVRTPNILVGKIVR
ncbi:Kelch repeat-containing protein [Pedobacter arcticus]|uniref:Kelch repeat-containing protein n=1 Tax=Pedobacter arcticus TaxID=752140 RepID=UPI0012B5DCAC|nr:hypothetical protein [Pedobacter arcticus]